MTLIIGIKCSDGLVLGADSAATMGSTAGHTAQVRTAKKLYICQDKIIMGCSGAVGLAQRLMDVVDEGYRGNKFKGRPVQAMVAMREQMAPHIQQEMQQSGLVSQALRNPNATSHAVVTMIVGLRIDKELALINFAETGAPELATEGLPFIAIGSGQPLADPFLAFVRRTLWPAKGLPSLADGILGAVWTLRHAIETNTGGVGGPIQLAQLAKNEKGDYTARELSEAEVGSHEEACKALDDYIGKWKGQFGAQPPGPEPTPPPA